MHPVNFLPGLQSGKEGLQGYILGALQVEAFLEDFLTKVGRFATNACVQMKSAAHK